MSKKIALISRIATANVGISDDGSQFYIQKGMGKHHARWIPVIARRAKMVLGRVLADVWPDYTDTPKACVVVNYSMKVIDFRPDGNSYSGFQFDVDAMKSLDSSSDAL